MAKSSIPVLSPSFLYHPYIPSFKSKDFSFTCIRESVDSLCRDETDAPMA